MLPPLTTKEQKAFGLTETEVKLYEERRQRKLNREAYKHREMSYEEKQEKWGEKNFTVIEKQLEERFKEIDRARENKNNNYFKIIILICAILSLILFFNGSIPFLVPVILILGWVSLVW